MLLFPFPFTVGTRGSDAHLDKCLWFFFLREKGGNMRHERVAAEESGVQKNRNCVFASPNGWLQ